MIIREFSGDCNHVVVSFKGLINILLIEENQVRNIVRKNIAKMKQQYPR